VIALKFLQQYLEVLFHGVDMDWLLIDEDVLSVELEYPLKRSKTLDPTVGSRSTFYRDF
jgi:hypothetical protein